MITLVRTELLKLTTIRSTWLVLLAAQFIVISGISGLVLTGRSLDDPKNVDIAVAHVGLASFCTIVFGILAVAGEYRHKTITDTYLSTPQRGRPLAAKILTYGAGGLVVGVASAVTALITATIWWSAKGKSFDLSSAGVWQTLGGCVVWDVFFAALGVSLGALLRNVTAAVAVTLAWIALIEGIAGQILGDGLARWLPFAAGQALGRATNPGTPHLPQVGAGVLVLGYVGIVVAVAAFTTLNRDVS